MKRKAIEQINRLAGLIVAAMLAFTLIPSHMDVAYAENETEKTVNGLGVTSLTDPQYGNGGWCKVYFGSSGTPIRFNVLNTNETNFGDATTLLLDCDSIVESIYAASYNEYSWGGSITRYWMRMVVLKERFTVQEQEAIYKGTKPEPAEGDVYPLYGYRGLEYEFDDLFGLSSI